MNQEIKNRAAAKVRELASAKWPYTPFKSGPKEELRKILGYTDRRTLEARWTGDTPYTISELAVIADALGVRVADLLINGDE